MDDYGRPLGDPSPGDDDGPRYDVNTSDEINTDVSRYNVINTDVSRYNVGLISEWHELPRDQGALVALARPGDLLEFGREAYQHWAVYIGEYARVMQVTLVNGSK